MEYLNHKSFLCNKIYDNEWIAVGTKISWERCEMFQSDSGGRLSLRGAAVEGDAAIILHLQLPPDPQQMSLSVPEVRKWITGIMSSLSGKLRNRGKFVTDHHDLS